MKHDEHESVAGRRDVLKGVMGAAAVGLATALSPTAHAQAKAGSPYADPEKSALPPSNMELTRGRTALLVVDPQNDFLSEKGVAWGVVGESVREQGTVANIERLFRAAKAADIPVVISPHYYYPSDKGWKFEGALEKVMHKIKMFDRSGPLNLGGFEGSGADWLERFKPYINDGKTIVASPHKVYGPQNNDVVLQLRKQRVDQVILAGMSANLCIESHLRELLETGFEVAVVKDATAGAKLPDGDGYLAALTNFRMIANAVWSADEATRRIAAMAG
ncbi:isochorismatase family protein [Aromatoleum toluvorans]|uniref:Isochorismatase family protein n=1 Tax=Aromatoleum toluvorans TaxID=92002 RepID=A0ABX1Q180_9RHOO|nr:cysteine hydrolase [Aromatoleum toluvorans]NMG44592.1 isochorismatase family protein [Aromatoleum toluvorans]